MTEQGRVKVVTEAEQAAVRRVAARTAQANQISEDYALSIVQRYWELFWTEIQQEVANG